MTTPLTIKDLNCSTCPHKIINPIGSRVCTIIACAYPDSYQIGIPLYQEIVGCASHPLALQVLSTPVITELEKLKIEFVQTLVGDECGYAPMAIDEAIKLLKGAQ